MWKLHQALLFRCSGRFRADMFSGPLFHSSQFPFHSVAENIATPSDQSLSNVNMVLAARPSSVYSKSCCIDGKVRRGRLQSTSFPGAGFCCFPLWRLILGFYFSERSCSFKWFSVVVSRHTRRAFFLCPVPLPICKARATWEDCVSVLHLPYGFQWRGQSVELLTSSDFTHCKMRKRPKTSYKGIVV